MLFFQTKVGRDWTTDFSGFRILEHVCVNGGVTHLAAGQRIIQRLSVDQLAPVIVDNHRAIVERVQHFRVNDVLVGKLPGVWIGSAQARVNGDEISLLRGFLDGCSVGEALGLRPLFAPGEIMHHHFEIEGAGNLCHFAANVAKTDDRHALTFDLFGREFLEVLAGVKIVVNDALMQRGHV